MMMIAQTGDRVRIRYTHMQDAREYVPQSTKPRVLEFTIGSEHLLPGLSRFVLGMQPGEQKCVTLPPAEAYGELQTRLIRRISRRCLHTKGAPEMGMLLTPRGSDSIHGLRWWQLDMSYWVIRTLELGHLAWNVKLPTPAAIARGTRR